MAVGSSAPEGEPLGVTSQARAQQAAADEWTSSKQVPPRPRKPWKGDMEGSGRGLGSLAGGDVRLGAVLFLENQDMWSG